MRISFAGSSLGRSQGRSLGRAPTRLRALAASVFVRAALLFIVSTLAVAGLMAWQSWRLTRDVARAGIVDMAVKTVQVRADSMADPLRYHTLDKVRREVGHALASGGDSAVAAVVIDPSGEVLVADGDLPGAELARLVALAVEARESAAPVASGDGLWRAVPVIRKGIADPLGAFAMIWTDAGVLAEARGQKLLILITATASLAGALVLNLLLLRRILSQPLKRLDAAMSAVGQGDYAIAVPFVGRRDEFGDLARHLGELVVTLNRGRAAEEARQAAHEAQDQVVRHLSEGLDRLADGALTETITEAFPEQYAALRDDYNRAVESLRAAVADVRAGARNIFSSAEEIARGSDDLSRRTETQAATLEETAAALDQLLSSVREAAQTTQEVERSVRDAARMADENGAVMSSAVAAMAGIEQSSSQIGEIIGVIDEIAFQTNLLALNAGVEAARAGASGKGFAVVASEVRALAQRSSDAAQQIKTLIGGSEEQVQEGVRLVERAGEALTGVVSKVGQISDLVSGIASVSADQAQGLNEINIGVTNLDRVTQQNAAMVEQSTAAAHMLREDAGRLSDLMDRFDTGSAAARSATGEDADRAA